MQLPTAIKVIWHKCNEHFMRYLYCFDHCVIALYFTTLFHFSTYDILRISKFAKYEYVTFC